MLGKNAANPLRICEYFNETEPRSAPSKSGLDTHALLKSDLVGEKYPAETADKNCDEDVTAVGSDESVLHKESDKHLHGEYHQKGDGVYVTRFQF